MNDTPFLRPVVTGICNTVTIVGLCLLALVFYEWEQGVLAEEFFPGIAHATHHATYALLLALPVPLHIIFIGLIVQKRWLSPGMARFAWIGITASGIWLGISLLVQFFLMA